MPILGIDYKKCINCGICVESCPRRLFSDNGDRIVHGDPNSMCIKCGHCIARCSEDAILYEDMGETYEFEGLNSNDDIVSYDKMYKFLQVHRSIRRYKKQVVPKELLQKVFAAMMYAPTARNMRSESFVLISDQEQLKTMSDAIQETLTNDETYGPLYREQFANLAKKFNAPAYFDAPHLIIVHSQLFIPIENQNIANIITYGRMAAHSLGLGTCWNGLTHVAFKINPKLMKLANIQAKQVGAFTIGYPDVTFYRTPPRRFKRVKGLD